MKIEFDPAKSARNAKERTLPFELTAELDWDAARVRPDDRRDYGEERYFALVPMSGRLYAVCYCVRSDAPDHQFSQGEQTRGAGLCEDLWLTRMARFAS